MNNNEIRVRKAIEDKEREANSYEDQECYNAAYCYGYDLIPYDKELNETAAKRKATRTKKRKDLGEDSEKSNSKLEQIEIPDIPDEDPDDEGDD